MLEVLKPSYRRNRWSLMRTCGLLLCLSGLLTCAILVNPAEPQSTAGERHLLYVAVPGIRNYVEYGGVGILVYDVDSGHKFIKRIPTWDVAAGQEPENVK